MVTQQHAMRNCEDEGLLGLVVSHCDHPAASLQETACFEVPATGPPKDDDGWVACGRHHRCTLQSKWSV